MFDIRVGDCLELIRDVPDGSVDMILSDLPYGTTAVRWDSIIPMQKLWPELIRVTRPRAAMVFTAVQPFTSMLVASNPRLFKHEWIWNKVTARGHLVAKKRPMQQHESLLVFERSGGAVDYYPKMIERDRPVKGRGRETSRTSLVGGKSTMDFPEGGKIYTHAYPKTIQTFSMDKRLGHPTQKPVALFGYMIETYTKTGETVLDVTAGSLTTAVAAENLGRNSICFEVSQDYVNIGMKRLIL